MNFRRILKASPIFVALASFYGPALSQAPASPRPEDALVAAYNATGERLFQDLAQEPGNIVLSPYSIGSALSMVLAGARGQTAAAISDTLGLHLSAADLAAANASLIANLKAAGGKDSVTLNSANALIEVRPGIVSADYRALLQKILRRRSVLRRSRRDQPMGCTENLRQDSAHLGQLAGWNGVRPRECCLLQSILATSVR